MIRLAKEDDLPQIIPLITEFVQESSYNDAPVETEPLMVTCKNFLLNQPDKCVTFVSEHEGKIHGLLVGFWEQLMFSSERRAFEVLWYFPPEYRNKSDAWRMLRLFEGWAIGHGCKSIMVTSLPSSPARLGDLYSREGYKLTEYAYLKSIR